jgi:hypothetical protein
VCQEQKKETVEQNMNTKGTRLMRRNKSNLKVEELIEYEEQKNIGKVLKPGPQMEQN